MWLLFLTSRTVICWWSTCVFMLHIVAFDFEVVKLLTYIIDKFHFCFWNSFFFCCLFVCLFNLQTSLNMKICDILLIGCWLAEISDFNWFSLIVKISFLLYLQCKNNESVACASLLFALHNAPSFSIPVFTIAAVVIVYVFVSYCVYI